jgi:hypothetical protein
VLTAQPRNRSISVASKPTVPVVVARRSGSIFARENLFVGAVDPNGEHVNEDVVRAELCGTGAFDVDEPMGSQIGKNGYGFQAGNGTSERARILRLF